MSPAVATSTAPIRILMIHGYTQSGPFFHLKTRALEKNLNKAFPERGVQLVYPTGPHKLVASDVPTWDSNGNASAPAAPAPSSTTAQTQDSAQQPDLDAWAWWRVQRDKVPWVYEGFTDTSLPLLVRILREEGPFDGIIGFSQGAAVAAIVAALLEDGREQAYDAFAARVAAGTWQELALTGDVFADVQFEPERFPQCLLDERGNKIHPPFKFAAAYSGFAAPHPRYTPYYVPKIKTPVCNFIGSVDTVVTEDRTMLLVNACENGRLVYHPGGHFLPSSQRDAVGALVNFIRDCLKPVDEAKPQEQGVEAMDMPF